MELMRFLPTFGPFAGPDASETLLTIGGLGGIDLVVGLEESGDFLGDGRAIAAFGSCFTLGLNVVEVDLTAPVLGVAADLRVFPDFVAGTMGFFCTGLRLFVDGFFCDLCSTMSVEIRSPTFSIASSEASMASTESSIRDTGLTGETLGDLGSFTSRGSAAPKCASCS